MTYNRSRRFVPSVELMPVRLTPSGSNPMDAVILSQSTVLTSTSNPMDAVVVPPSHTS